MDKKKARAESKPKAEDPGIICGWCDGTGEDKGAKCPLCLGKGRRFASKEDEARWKKLYTPKKKQEDFMAKVLKVKLFPISSPADLVTLEEFLSGVGAIEHMVKVDGKVLVVFEEE